MSERNEHHLCQDCGGHGRTSPVQVCKACEGSGEGKVSRAKKELQAMMKSQLESNIRKDIEAEIRGNLQLRAELEKKIRAELAAEAKG